MRTIVKNIIYFFVTFISLLFVAFTVVVYYPGNSLEKSLIGRSSNNDFTNHRQNDFLNWLNIKEKEKPSLLLLGASKTYRGLNPGLFNVNGYSSFNAGGSSQQLDISYFVLKEVLRYKQVNMLRNIIQIFSFPIETSMKEAFSGIAFGLSSNDLPIECMFMSHN